MGSIDRMNARLHEARELPHSVYLDVKVALREPDADNAKIAAQRGLSRDTVIKIAAGKHPAAKRYRRCPGCGGKQLRKVPCRVCQIDNSPRPTRAA